MKNLIIVRGAGDIASGVIQKLHRCGFPVVALEVEKPSFIRRRVCFGEAIYDGSMEIEGSRARYAMDTEEAMNICRGGEIAVLIDSQGKSIERLKPMAVVDAILAKKNCGTSRKMAPITIGLGPGFEAGTDVDIAVETMRGHDLGRLIFKGKPQENTGVPGVVGGYGRERVIYSECEGIIVNKRKIGDIVERGDVVATVGETVVRAPLGGVIRGLIRSFYRVKKGLKIGDIDPRKEQVKNCFTISDKARNIGGAVLEGILILKGGCR
jgi:xanthine dehydrogenase accessory factor